MVDDSVILVFLVGATVLLGGVYTLWRYTLRRRTQILAGEVKVPPDDRAFNQIRITRASATHLGAQGYDVSGIQGQLDRAEERYRNREHAAALRIAEGARDQLRLVHTHSATATAAVAGSEGGEPDVGPEVLTEPAAPAALSRHEPPPAPTPAPAKIPKGLVEARFTLSLLEQEIGKAEQASPSDPRLGEVRTLRDTARTEFEEKRYPESWRTALRARRHLGSMVEAVSLGSPKGAPSEEASESEEAPAAAPHCAQCGHELRGNEKFCRACGASLSAHRCPRCNASVEPNDVYCHACGAPVGA
jgi:hypothetical protein